MNPVIVTSPNFGILWKKTHNSKERFYAKPLVYTPPGKSQLVFLASSMNIIRTLDAVTGAAINSRTLQPPFRQSDIGCTDIPDWIGIIGTPIIDPNTDTVYLFSKGYEGGAAGGGVALGSQHPTSLLLASFVTNLQVDTGCMQWTSTLCRTGQAFLCSLMVITLTMIQKSMVL